MWIISHNDMFLFEYSYCSNIFVSFTITILEWSTLHPMIWTCSSCLNGDCVLDSYYSILSTLLDGLCSVLFIPFNISVGFYLILHLEHLGSWHWFWTVFPLSGLPLMSLPLFPTFLNMSGLQCPFPEHLFFSSFLGEHLDLKYYLSVGNIIITNTFL